MKLGISKFHADLPFRKTSIYMYCASQDKGSIFLFIYVATSLNIGLRVLTEGEDYADNFKLGMSLHYADKVQGHS